MHREILTADQIAVLDGLKRIRRVGSFYLAGGTALALRHGHRRSIDFDFFRERPFDVPALLAALEREFPDLERLPTAEQTLYVRLHGVTTSFFKLAYPLLRAREPTPWGFGLASDDDIAAMKLEAVAGRGSRKDFVDLRLLCARGIRLEQVLALFERKYGVKRTETYHRLRALAYFEDADREPVPDMLVPLDWDEVKTFFASGAARLLARGIRKSRG